MGSLVPKRLRCGGIGGGRINDVWDVLGSVATDDRGLISSSPGGGHNEELKDEAGPFRSDGAE